MDTVITVTSHEGEKEKKLSKSEWRLTQVSLLIKIIDAQHIHNFSSQILALGKNHNEKNFLTHTKFIC